MKINVTLLVCELGLGGQCGGFINRDQGIPKDTEEVYIHIYICIYVPNMTQG